MMPHARKLVGAVVLAVALVLAGAPATADCGCVPPSGPGAFGSGTLGDWTIGSHAVSSPARIQEAVDTGGVWLLGDSLTVSSHSDFSTRLHAATGLVMAANGKSGRPTPPTVDVLDDWKATYGLPPVVIMATGANDIFGPDGPNVMAAQIDRAAAIVGPNVKLIWIEPHISRWLQPEYIQVNDQRNTGWLCGIIWQATQRHPNLSVVAWERYLSVNPERVRAYLSDGVHVNETGKAARNTLTVQAVQDALGLPR